ncbi:MAG: NADH-quinone oxidoreductase subunit L, partial [Chlorobi bacterium]|nr:NADH-quinone oxidoreductase subunit L [Chlorobiota bacterium]
VAVIGAITAFLAATIALVQNDIKKVLAYSTISQLGYMVFAVGLGAYTAALFHLATHAMFKALLFLGSGSVIHAMHHSLHHLHDHETDPQDIRNMGGLGKKMPVTYITFVIASLSISGIPFFSGFLSKDEILASAWAFGSLKGGLAVLFPYIGYGVAALTAFYMFRLVFLTFTGEPKRSDIFEHVKESGWNMKLPLVILAVLSTWIFFAWNPFGPSNGWFMQSVKTPHTVVGDNWYVFGAAGHVAEESVAAAGALGMEMQELLEHTVHEVHTVGMFVSLFLALSGILVAFLFYTKKVVDVDALERRYKPVHRFLLNKWYFDELYEKWLIVPGILLLTRVLNWFDGRVVDGAVNGAARVTVIVSRISGWIDKYIVDGLVNFSAYFAGFAGLVVRKFQTGRIQTYVAFALLGVVILFYAFY